MSKALDDLHRYWVKRSTSRQAYYDVFWLMAHYLGIEWADLMVRHSDDFPKSQMTALEEALAAYFDGKPLAYILGSVPFLGLEIKIEEGVLVPRVDTEFMVNCLIQKLAPRAKILEWGVGSGAISCALAKNIRNVSIVAVDKSILACQVAKNNSEILGLGHQITVVEGDWYQECTWEGFDAMVSNPPYIAPGDRHLSPKVAAYEPKTALLAEDNGFADLQRLISVGMTVLKDGGLIALEHGYLQQERVVSALCLAGYQEIECGSDNQHPRFVTAVKPSAR
ncbi:peptide chain release factor N(5)-glutamine methyltransferase [Candidatus Synchoanobacter obligatus]|uniref:peptide chain release factor N(5)-glutamine methyltransferase n=1 Tax=Candidatus Synchoanobacter obligatus TaxID=2919597 RepID=A0ABT1L4K0_9GAMM|nr:peptide chain release factor N(5)-glutamine methyltransferase [Candidatus Synchoanobacter obligatus]MCP8352104.1 peptide chain release factor N(5)-glutamine methyltransferase [Candidatus Synchoanobacter obligatus]